jgi:hypothetical protein
MSPRPTSTPDTRGYTTRDFNGLYRLRWNASELIADSVRLVSESVPDDWLAQIIPYRLRCRGLVW